MKTIHSLSENLSEGMMLPKGSSDERGNPEAGYFRYNTDDKKIEVFDGTDWSNMDYAPSYVTSGLAMHFDAGNPNSYGGTGSTWSDLSQGGNGGSITGASYNSEGYFTFDGTSDYLSSNYTATFQDFTLCAFAKANNPNGKQWEDIVDSFDLDSSDWCRIALFQGIPTLEIDANSTRSSVRSSTIAVADQWYHIVGVRSGTTGYLYVNGILNQQNVVTGNVISADTDSQFGIGNIGRPSLRDEGWNGDIAQVAIYDRALTSSEVTQNFNANKSRFGL